VRRREARPRTKSHKSAKPKPLRSLALDQTRFAAKGDAGGRLTALTSREAGYCHIRQRRKTSGPARTGPFQPGNPCAAQFKASRGILRKRFPFQAVGEFAEFRIIPDPTTDARKCLIR
jgi:hypothetical protein